MHNRRRALIEQATSGVKPLYLYNNGDKCLDVIGGWTVIRQDKYFYFSFQNTYVLFGQSSGNLGEVRTQNPMDISKYKELHIGHHPYDGGSGNAKKRIQFLDKDTEEVLAESYLSWALPWQSGTWYPYQEFIMDINSSSNNAVLDLADLIATHGNRMTSIVAIWLE